MKHKLAVWWLCGLLITGLFTGCAMTGATGSSAGKPPIAKTVSIVKQNNAENDTVVQGPADDKDIEKLYLHGSRLPEQTDLRVLKFENGRFYGLGHGPSDDGCRLKSCFKFDFYRNFSESIDGSRCFYSDAQEFPVGSGIFYYVQADQDSQEARFMRVNYNTFTDEILLDTRNIALDDIVSFCPGGQSVYYLDRRDNCIWQQSFADGGKVKICEIPADSSEVNEIYVYNNAAYVMRYDSCMKIDTINNTRADVISGRILNRYDHEIYFLNIKNIICIYDIYTGETVETGVFSLYSRPYCMGRWTAILSNPANTIYIWDTEQKKVVQQIKHDKIRHLAGAYENRYFLYTISTDTLGVIDIKAGTDELIDIRSFRSVAGNPIDRWYIDENYLYAQDIYDPESGEQRGDEFYRLSLSCLTPAGSEQDALL
jgi:WD40 repeat protein